MSERRRFVDEYLRGSGSMTERCASYGISRRAGYRFLACGILEHGFVRIRCDHCAHAYLLAFSCKCRYFCPSCRAKRLAIWAEWLDTTRLAPVPHRQVVLAIPKRLRAYCLYRRRPLGEIARVAARTVDLESPAGVTAQKPLVNVEIKQPRHPVFYGCSKTVVPMKFGQGQQVFRVGVADQDRVLAQFMGGDEDVLSGLMSGAENLRGRAFAMDVPEAYKGKGRVIMFANNPIYRWQNHGEFNMVFDAIVNGNDVPGKAMGIEP